MWKVPLFRVFWDEQDVDMVNGVLRRGEYWANGPEIKEFEIEISKYVGAKYCVAFNSGTSALHATLLACKLNSSAKIAIPSFSFIATANCVLFINAKPVFVDIEEQRLGLDPEKLSEIIKNQEIDAIIPVHYSGLPCDIKVIMEVADRKKNIVVIEDAAESFGATMDGKKTGIFGTAGVFSFAPNKIITTGEGGAVVTDSKEIFERLLLARSHGRLETVDYFSSNEPSDYVDLGFNFRMPSIVAALGIAQMKKVEKVISLRRERAKYISRNLSKLKDVLIPNEPAGSRHVFQMYSIRVMRNRDELMKKLSKSGLMSKVYFSPIHLTTFYRRLFGYVGGELPTTEKISKEILTLPFYPNLTEAEMDQVIAVVREHGS